VPAVVRSVLGRPLLSQQSRLVVHRLTAGASVPGGVPRPARPRCV